ncbi:MAG: hypothetical protein IJZ57_00970 [Clostridia bacterium]|nr:hypothetical protein [Clostridia bacterium]
MTDARTLAYINMYAVLGTLENLCELSEEARQLVKTKKPVSIGFEVNGGPSATITFKNGRCRMQQGCDNCDVKLPFSSCEKFNGLIDGTVTPIPSKGFTKIGFLLKQFTPLTDMLSKYMRPSEEDLKDEAFFELSTNLLFYTISVAISQIANNDEIGQFSAKHIPDGNIKLSIAGGPASTITVKDHRLVTVKKSPDKFRALMEFADMKLAHDLFDGKVNAIAKVGEGEIVMKGMINMLDNMNRILDRVALYLA